MREAPKPGSGAGPGHLILTFLLVCLVAATGVAAPEADGGHGGGGVGGGQAEARAVEGGAAERIVVIGDVQGAYESLVALLKHARLVNDDLQWVGGSAVLVQTGDLLDRGTRVRDVLDLMMRLRREAPASQGRVVVLLGNHEAMSILGELRDVSYMAYETFADEGSARRQDEAYRAHVEWLQSRAEALGQPAPEIDEQIKADWLAAHPLGFQEYVASMGPEGAYGRWLRSLPVAVRVDDLVMIHGGVSPAMQGLDLEAINRSVHDEIAAFDGYRARMVELGMVVPHTSARDMATTLVAEIEHLNSLDPARRDRERALQAAELQDMTGWGSWSLLDEDGPLWFRGASRWDEGARGEQMASLVDGLGAARMITGQSADDNRIGLRFGGRVALVSTGMSDDPWERREPGYLEISDGTLTAVTLKGRTVLAEASSKGNGGG